jgi:hypothetical protein
MAIGNDQFKQEIEVLTGRRMTEQKMGRPISSQKSNKQTAKQS